MRNNIYYLLDLQQKCFSISTYDYNTITKYCEFVNSEK